MTQVFIGGSRKVSRLDSTLRARMDNIMNGHFTVLIGDANGVDKAVQSYLSSKGYGNVLVYHVGERSRNNIGQWEEKRIETGKTQRGFDFYAAKDMEMAKDASYGFMIWDGKSKGTLNNVLNLLHLEKQVLVFFSPTKQYFTLKSKADIANLLNNCSQNDRTNFINHFSLDKPATPQQVHFRFDYPHPND